jgi:hypothetical protein
MGRSLQIDIDQATSVSKQVNYQESEEDSDLRPFRQSQKTVN